MSVRGRDVAIVLAVFAGTVVMLAAGGFGTPDPGHAELDAAGVLLSALTALPLLVRRTHPLPAYAVVAAASVVLLGARYPLDMPLGVIVAIYHVAIAFGGGSRPRRIAAQVAVGAFVPLVVAGYEIGGFDAAGVAPELLGWLAFVTGLWIAGDRAQLRAARFAEMRERAERAERDAARERRLAAAEERTRIARELHDSAGHAINVILVQAGAARLLHEQDPTRSQEALATIEEVARDTIGEIDRLVRALREDEDGLPADPGALEQLVKRHRGSGLDVAADVRGPRGTVPRSVAWAAYRIVQEALTNAARHGSGPAELVVDFGADAAEIVVRNAAPDGGAPADGHGITGMRERATLLGGTLDIRAAGGTFRLRARLPYGEVAA